MRRTILLSLTAAGLVLGGCTHAQRHGGAIGAVGGAAVSVVAGASLLPAVAVGAAAGAVVGELSDHNKKKHRRRHRVER